MLNPLEVKIRANKLENANYKFRTFLKNHADPDELDKQFLELHNGLFTDYNCADCRNCCKDYAAVISEDELEPVISFLQLTREEFLNKYVKEARDDSFELSDVPCRFLMEDNTCQIENCKPQNCREYPFTNKPERLWSLLSIIDSTFVCPVVFEIIERLKKIYRFKY
jgi:Fe-S-cluster containining protein